MTYRHILIPIDGSATSFKALEEGLKLSKLHKSFTTVLFVVPTGIEYVGIYNHQLIKRALRREGEKLLKEAQKIADQMNIFVYQRIAEGKPYEEIINTAKRLGCDLIVIGSRGRGIIDKFFLGSCTERVLAEAPCPVLVVKD